MSWQAALNSHVFQVYALLAVALLSAGGAVLAFLKWGLRKNVDHALRAYVGWLILTPSALISIGFGRLATIALFTLTAISAFKEFARATGLYRDWGMTLAVYGGILACGLLATMNDPTDGVPGWYGMFMALPVYVIAVILLIPILRNATKGQLQSVALAVVGFIYIGWMFGHLAFLANSKHAYGYLLYILFAVELSDVAAYTFGKVFGKRSLRSNISPRKTWAGSLGSLLVAMILPWSLRFSFPQFEALQLILTGLIVGIGSQIGDLTISVFKRDIGIKDMGAVLPGHGGVLDRIDSLIYVAPLFFHMMRYFHGLY